MGSGGSATEGDFAPADNAHGAVLHLLHRGGLATNGGGGLDLGRTLHGDSEAGAWT